MMAGHEFAGGGIPAVVETLQAVRTMKKNMGAMDRTIRTLAVLAIPWLYFTGRISGTLAIVLGVVSVAFLVTSMVAWCPAYLPFGLSTLRKPKPKA